MPFHEKVCNKSNVNLTYNPADVCLLVVNFILLIGSIGDRTPGKKNLLFWTRYTYAFEFFARFFANASFKAAYTLSGVTTFFPWLKN